MVFHRARIKTKSSEISIRDNTIPRLTRAKLLGFIIDDQLKLYCTFVYLNLVYNVYLDPLIVDK